ncbi:hypothetical protein NX029_26320 [Cytobacillus firmus]|nr:hypothetical protein [Cytobacillus firmus]
MNVELLLLLKDKKNRSLVRYVLEMFDEYEEVREIGQRLHKDNQKMLQQIMELKKDKQALIAFIENNVTDEKALAEIFPKG